jgi:ATP-dependent RNA helicase HelY
MKLSMPEMPPAILLTALGAYNLLPAIIFLPTRRRCDQAASESALLRRDPDNERRDARRDFMLSFSEKYPEVRAHRHRDTILRGGVASHHAGHLPAWKLAIEKLMSAGLLDAIFATATVAAGVDFPARTVVITGVDARTGSGWRQLSASELQQMTGRAGRRGRDNVGFIVAAPGLHQDPERIVSLLRAQPDPLASQFRATYTTLLNLLDAFGSFEHVREIAAKSFAHRETANLIKAAEAEIARSEKRIEEKLATTEIPVSLEVALGFERLVSARTHLQELKPQTRAEMLRQWLEETVRPGRIVGIGRSGRRLVMITERREGNVFGIREDGRPASFPLERIGRVYAPVYRLREPSIESAFEEIRQRGRDLVIREPGLRSRTEETSAIKLIDDLIDSLTPARLEETEKNKFSEVLWATLDDAAALQRAIRRIDQLQTEVWLPFELRARVLAVFGYLDFEKERVTERGRWLADLHLDRPLVVGEALENGLFRGLDVARMAGVVAALTADEDRDYGELELDDALVETLSQFEDVGFRVASEEWKHGVEPAPELNFSAAATAAYWARGKDWSMLVHETRAEEGDLFRMLSRTGEALLQIAGLRKTHPEAARIAAAAAEVVLRDPVR